MGRRSEIFYDVQESKYSFSTENLTFFFSSILYMQKFICRYKINRKVISDKLIARYGVDFNATDYFDIILYAETEKRGFKVVTSEGSVIKCLENVNQLLEKKKTD